MTIRHLLWILINKKKITKLIPVLNLSKNSQIKLKIINSLYLLFFVMILHLLQIWMDLRTIIFYLSCALFHCWNYSSKHLFFYWCCKNLNIYSKQFEFFLFFFTVDLFCWYFFFQTNSNWLAAYFDIRKI